LTVTGEGPFLITTSITGGIIDATGYSGPGIGSRDGTINISGGTVTATSSSYGAGIGGGYREGGGTINISGGTVVATGAGTRGGAGIGKGHAGGDGAIVISQALVTASSQFGNDVISAGSGGTIYIGFTSSPGSPAYDPVITRAKVTLANGGINAATTTFDTCQITGAGAGDLAGEYIEGVKQVATYSIAAINNRHLQR